MMRLWLILAALPFSMHAHAALFMRGGTSSAITSPCSTGTANQQAACLTAQNNSLCQSSVLGDFYAEIDNASSVLWSYQSGLSIGRNTLIQLDSATKPVDGAYWVQYRGGVNSLTADDVLHLHQQSGYVNQPSKCAASGTVLACLADTPGTGCSSATGYTINGLVVSASAYGALCTLNQGLFTYNGGNFQSHAAIDGPSSFYNLGRAGVANAVNMELNTPTFTATFTNGSATITNTGNNGLSAGMHVYLSGTVPAPFSNFTTSTPTGVIYYVTKINSSPTITSFQLSATKGANGAAITATASGSGATVTVTPFTYSMPLLAGGGNQSPAGMVTFLQAIINPSTPLLYNGALGAYESCTNYPTNGEPSPGIGGRYYAYLGYAAQTLNGTTTGSPFSPVTVTTGTTVGSGPNGPWINNGACQTNSTGVGGSPIPENMKYSIATWVESDPVSNGDGAFSGIGSKGAYSWVDSSKTYAGVLFRVGSGGSGFKSTQCGRLLRHAYLTATQQTGNIPTP